MDEIFTFDDYFNQKNPLLGVAATHDFTQTEFLPQQQSNTLFVNSCVVPQQYRDESEFRQRLFFRDVRAIETSSLPLFNSRLVRMPVRVKDNFGCDRCGRMFLNQWGLSAHMAARSHY